MYSQSEAGAYLFLQSGIPRERQKCQSLDSSAYVWSGSHLNTNIYCFLYLFDIGPYVSVSEWKPLSGAL